MATQGQRRAEGRAAIRKLRAEYRKVDSAGEVVERELDRLIKRKTFISADQLRPVSDKLITYIKLAESLQRQYALTFEIISRLPI